MTVSRSSLLLIITLKVLRSTGKVFCRSLNVGFQCLCHDETEIVCFGEECHRGECPSHHTISGVHAIHMAYPVVRFALITWLGWFLSGSFTVKLLFSPLSMPFSLELSH